MRDDALLSRRAAEFDPVVHALNRFAPLVTRAHLALPHPCGVRPWLLPRHHNDEISFLFLFAFPFLLFCLPPNVVPMCLPPNVRVAAPTAAVEAGGGK